MAARSKSPAGLLRKPESGAPRGTGAATTRSTAPWSLLAVSYIRGRASSRDRSDEGLMWPGTADASNGAAAPPASPSEMARWRYTESIIDVMRLGGAELVDTGPGGEGGEGMSGDRPSTATLTRRTQRCHVAEGGVRHALCVSAALRRGGSNHVAFSAPLLRQGWRGRGGHLTRLAGRAASAASRRGTRDASHFAASAHDPQDAMQPTWLALTQLRPLLARYWPHPCPPAAPSPRAHRLPAETAGQKPYQSKIADISVTRETWTPAKVRVRHPTRRATSLLQL